MGSGGGIGDFLLNNYRSAISEEWRPFFANRGHFPDIIPALFYTQFLILYENHLEKRAQSKKKKYKSFEDLIGVGT